MPTLPHASSDRKGKHPNPARVDPFRQCSQARQSDFETTVRADAEVNEGKYSDFDRRTAGADGSRCIATDLSPIRRLTQLTSLELSGLDDLRDLSVLDGLGQLKQLHLSGVAALSDLGHLTGLASLETLSIEGSATLTDLSALAACSSLESLSLARSKTLGDISPLARLPGLRRLDLTRCHRVTDCRPLLSMPSLEFVRMGEFQTSDKSVLRRLRSRMHVEFQGL